MDKTKKRPHAQVADATIDGRYYELYEMCAEAQQSSGYHYNILRDGKSIGHTNLSPEDWVAHTAGQREFPDPRGRAPDSELRDYLVELVALSRIVQHEWDGGDLAEAVSRLTDCANLISYRFTITPTELQNTDAVEGWADEDLDLSNVIPLTR